MVNVETNLCKNRYYWCSDISDDSAVRNAPRILDIPCKMFGKPQPKIPKTIDTHITSNYT